MIEELNNYLMLPEEIKGIGEVYPIRLKDWDKFSKLGGMIFSNGIQNIKNLYKFEGDYSLDFYVGKGTPAFVFKKTYDNLMSNIDILNTIEKNIIENNIKDDIYIQRKLDELLDVLLFYENDDTLLVFRKLCKYYFSINPQATVRYINFYKEQNDPEEVKFGKK